MTCDGYVLGNLPGLRFCDKATARRVAAIHELSADKSSLLCALAFDHMRTLHIPASEADPETGAPAMEDDWITCELGHCVFCDAEHFYPVRT